MVDAEDKPTREEVAVWRKGGVSKKIHSELQDSYCADKNRREPTTSADQPGPNPAVGWRQSWFLKTSRDAPDSRQIEIGDDMVGKNRGIQSPPKW